MILIKASRVIPSPYSAQKRNPELYSIWEEGGQGETLAEGDPPTSQCLISSATSHPSKQQVRGVCKCCLLVASSDIITSALLQPPTTTSRSEDGTTLSSLTASASLSLLTATTFGHETHLACLSRSASASASYHHHHHYHHPRSKILPRLSIDICLLPPPTTTKPSSLVRQCVYSIMTSTSVTASKPASACYANNNNRGEDCHVILINPDLDVQIPASTRYTSTMDDGHGDEEQHM